MTAPTTWNPLDKAPDLHLTGGNLTCTGPIGGLEGVRGTTSHSSGKWYLEYPVNTANGIGSYRGFASASQSMTSSTLTYAFGIEEGSGYYTGPGGNYGPAPGGAPGGHNVQFAIDITAGLYWFRYGGGAWVGQVSGAADPTTGVNGINYAPTVAAGVALFPWVMTQHWTVDGVQTLNPGSSTFANTAPSGFTAWDATTAVSTPEIQSTSGASITGAGSGTIAYTTVGTDNIIVLFSQSSPNHTSGSVDISTVTDTHSLTWTKKTSLHILSASSPNVDNTQEVWWAHAATALSGTITVTYGATIDDAALTTVSVSGVYDPTSPWDPNVSLPATASNTTGSAAIPSVTLSTTAASTLVLGFYGAPINHAETSGANSLFLTAHQNNAGGTNWGYNYVGEMAFTSPQTSVTASFGSSVSRWGFIVVALDGTTSVTSPTGTMAVTEAPDTLAATGLTPDTGTIADTEAPDVFAAIGTGGPLGTWGALEGYEAADVFAATGHSPDLGTMAALEFKDHFSAYGYMPISGHMASTEHPDIFLAAGIGLGRDGTFVAIEAPDIFLAAGRTPVVGILAATEAADRFLALSAGVTQVRRRHTFFVT